MSTLGGGIRRLGAAQRREEREARRRQRELERRLKEREKLSALEQARLDVEAYENELEVLLSVHKDQHPATDWITLASSLPPHTPLRLGRHELAVLLKQAASKAFNPVGDDDSELAAAREIDERLNQAARAEFDREFAHWQRFHSLAQRVLAGEARAYTEAVSEFPNLAEISNLGSSIHMTVHDAKLVECVLKVNGRDVIPLQVKSLTAAGKLAVKPMPKSQFHELYQDYVCGCILRLAREIFALLPVSAVLLTAIVDGIDFRTGHSAELPVLSMAAPRQIIERLDYERLNPSDALENFQHRGDVIASRRSDAFVQIVPLGAEEINPTNPGAMEFVPLVGRVRKVSAEIDELLKPRSLGTIAAGRSGGLSV